MQLFKIIGFNKVLHHLDLRNTGLKLDLRNKMRDILKGNKAKNETYFKAILEKYSKKDMN